MQPATEAATRVTAPASTVLLLDKYKVNMAHESFFNESWLMRTRVEPLRGDERVNVVEFYIDKKGLAVCIVRVNVSGESPVELIFRQTDPNATFVEREDQDGGPVPGRVFLSARNRAKDEIRTRLGLKNEERFLQR